VVYPEISAAILSQLIFYAFPAAFPPFSEGIFLIAV
jgi:hypothetical protein